jgi:hypothetical protein
MAHTRPKAREVGQALARQTFLAAIFPQMSAWEGYEKLLNSRKKWLLRHSRTDGMLSMDYKNPWRDEYHSNRMCLTAMGWIIANKNSELQQAQSNKLSFAPDNSEQGEALQLAVNHYVKLFKFSWDDGLFYHAPALVADAGYEFSYDDPYERIEALLQSTFRHRFFHATIHPDDKPESGEQFYRCSSPGLRND